ncbi:VOC family protein [Pseudonocardia sp. H11422]|uniref:VOC family protein n=1 Tax=Pseudonocardia sp. H11422 TaxID=2835866 RepID=UPI001BDD3718|nr:VOC family protein [Pseudonocardia sp. H11422]
MPVQRLNHAVLYVRDVDRSVAFYSDALGFRTKVAIPGRAAFLQAEDSTNDHDLGLFALGSAAGASQAGRATVGLYHLAWEVDTLAELKRIAGVLAERGALVGASDHGSTKALYAHDPDGIEFEVSWLVPAELLPETVELVTRPLDLDAEIARYGATTPGGSASPSRPRPDPGSGGHRASPFTPGHGPSAAGSSPRHRPGGSVVSATTESDEHR